MQKKFSVLMLIMILAAFQPELAPAEAMGGQLSSPQSAKGNINDLTDQILKKEFDLEKLNTQFRIESTKQGAWRPWRTFGYAEVNAAATGSGLIAGMALFYPTTMRPKSELIPTIVQTKGKPSAIELVKKTIGTKAPNRYQLIGSQIPQLVGQVEGATGDAIELGVNYNRYRKLKAMGYDGKSYRTKAKALMSDIDRLLAERSQLLKDKKEDQPSEEVAVATAEGQILKDYRDLSYLHFAQYHSSAAKLHVFENAAFAIDWTKNTTGYIGNIFNIYATDHKYHHLIGTASLFTCISGVLIVATPIFGRVSGSMAGLVDRRIVNGDYANAEIKDATSYGKHRQELHALITSKSDLQGSNSDLQLRDKIYTRIEGLVTDHERDIASDEKAARKTRFENVIFGTLVGGSKIALGTCGMLAGWRYYDAADINHGLAAAGNTAYASGTWLGFFENARVRYNRTLEDKKKKTKQLLPGQILATRIQTLDEMEHMLAATPKAPELGP